METEGKRITRNTLFITAALVGQKFFSFLYFTMVARVMGVEDTGRYFLAVSFGLMFSVVADLGFAPFLVREAAKAREGVSGQLRSILGAKAVLAVITIVIMNGIAWVLPYPAITKQLIALASVSVVIESAHLTLYSILRGLQRLEFESAGIVGGQAIALLLGGISLWLTKSLHFLIVALLVGNIANFLWALYFVAVRFRIPLRFTFEGRAFRALFLTVLPFTLAAIFNRVTGFIDSFLLSILGTEEMVGLYSVPFKVTFALQFIPLAFAASLLPSMSALFAEKKETFLAMTFIKSTLYLFFIALPVAFGIASLAEIIIPVVFGEQYLPAIATQRLLVMSIIFIFASFPVGSFLVATNRQTIHTTLVGAAMVVNIAINIVLIPRLGFLGSAIAAVTSTAFLFVTGFFFAARTMTLPFDALLHGAAKAFVAGSAMVGVLFLTKASLPLFLLIPLGALVYGAVMFLTRAVTPNELRMLISSLRYGKDITPDAGVSS